MRSNPYSKISDIFGRMTAIWAKIFIMDYEINILTDKEDGEVIPSDTPEDIWDLLQEQKKKK